MIETVQYRHYCQRTFAGKTSIQTLTCRISAFWRNEEKNGVWVCSVQQTNYWLVETSVCILCSFIQKHSARLRSFWQIEETVCGRRMLDVSISEKVCFKLQLTKSNAQKSSAVFLCGVVINGPETYGLVEHPLKSVLTTSCRCKDKMNWTQFQCSCWGNDTTSE